jgi:hypothetical protein
LRGPARNFFACALQIAAGPPKAVWEALPDRRRRSVAHPSKAMPARSAIVSQIEFASSRVPVTSFHAELRAFSAAIESELRNRELSFPTVLDLSLRIRQVANDPDSTVDQLAGLIRVEPVLSARVVRMANSVIYNRAGRRISSVSEAVPRIGLSNIRVLALIVAMDQLAQEHRSKSMRELAKSVWQHSLDVGSWAYALSRYVRVGSPDTALLVGLMTDIGRLCLIARVGQYPAIAADAKGFAEIADFWSDALTRAVLERMDVPGDVMDALDYNDAYAGRWLPATLHELLYVAGLVAQGDAGQDEHRQQVRRNQREATRQKVGAAAFDGLLAAAETLRDELLSILRD